MSTTLNFTCIEELNDKFDEIARLTHGMRHIIVPRIAVIGDQSNGKSSLLESMSGVDLPRGYGICTRVPLIMQLRKQKDNKPSEITIQATTADGKLMFEEIKDENMISDAIVRYTEILAGPGKSIKDIPITLTITKKNLVNLTMIDLPGIVHNDNDADKMRAIDAMVENYIKEDETIILNVLNAAQEAANSKSLHMSAKYDRNHERTLLVITKIDQTSDNEGLNIKFTNFHEGDDAFPDGHVFLVRNRTLTECENKTKLLEVRANERAFFDGRQDMQGLPDSCKGSQALTQKMADMQTKRMLRTLPKLKKSIYKKLFELRKKQQEFPIICKTENECRSKLAVIISSIFSKLQNSIRGIIIDNSLHTNKKYLCSEVDDIRSEYAHKIQSLHDINFFFSEDFLIQLKEEMNLIKGGLICMPNEIHPSVAVCAFKILLGEINAPFNSFLNELMELSRIEIDSIINELCGGFYSLKKLLLSTFDDILQDQKLIADNYMRDALESERSIMYTHNHHYLRTVYAMEHSFTENTESKVVNNNDNNNIRLIRVVFADKKELFVQFNGYYEKQNGLRNGKNFYVRMHGEDSYSLMFDASRWQMHKNYGFIKNATFISQSGYQYPWQETQWMYNSHIYSVRVEKVQMMDNFCDEQELLLKKQAIRIAAYWETVCKAFIDRTVKMSQLYLVVHLSNDKAHARLHEEICKYDVNKLMSINSLLRAKIARNEKDLLHIQQAQEIIYHLGIGVANMAIDDEN